MRKTIYLARCADEGTDTCKAFFTEQDATKQAQSWLDHLTKKERMTNTVSVERYEFDVPEDDARDAEALFRDVSLESDTLNPVDYREIKEPVAVEFSGGQSREGDTAVNYMLAEIGRVELYAEEPLPEDLDPDDPKATAAFDDESYDRLKAEILRQAQEKHIDVSTLKFWWD